MVIFMYDKLVSYLLTGLSDFAFTGWGNNSYTYAFWFMEFAFAATTSSIVAGMHAIYFRFIDSVQHLTTWLVECL